jgi:hypothetical protein
MPDNDATKQLSVPECLTKNLHLVAVAADKDLRFIDKTDGTYVNLTLKSFPKTYLVPKRFTQPNYSLAV